MTDELTERDRAVLALEGRYWCTAGARSGHRGQLGSLLNGLPNLTRSRTTLS